MKKALVTGGSGFLGHHIVKELCNRRIETVVYDAVESNYINDYHNTGFIQFFKGDVRDITSLDSAMKGCDTVFHTAAIANIDDTTKHPLNTIDVNVMGTVNCLETARNQNIERFIYASSVYVAGNRGSFYRVSKQTGESLCKTYFEEFNLNYSIIRYGSLYGREANHWNFLYTVLKELLTEKEFTYYASPDAVREYIHINDAARESVNIAQNKEFLNKAALITGHQKMSMREFFDMIQEILGKSLKINYVNDDKHSHYKITPYSFEPEMPLRINLSTYIDICEGVLDCAKEVQNEIESNK